MIASLLILFGLMLLGFPLYLGILASGLYLQLFVNHVPLQIVITGLYNAVAKPSILAVPLFILAGSIMSGTSVGRRLVDSVLPWIANRRGGVPIGVLLSHNIFGAVSGSSPAAVGTVGRITYPLLTKSNDERLALGLITSSGAIAIVMPPSITMILYAAATNTSTGQLFLAGVIPSFIIAMVVAPYLIWRSPARSDLPPFQLKAAIAGLIKAIPVLFMPVIILGGIYAGVFTPTEAAAVAVAYCLLISVFVFRELSWAGWLTILDDTMRIIAQIFIIITASTVFSQALTIMNLPQQLASLLSGISPFVFLLLVNVLLLFVGCFFDPAPATLVLAPILTPVANALGIDLIHLGIVFTVNLAIGMFTPPYGLNIFVVQSVFKFPLERIARSVVPFFILYVVALLIITYWPNLYMWLPRR